jgi:hypothetical protein
LSGVPAWGGVLPTRDKLTNDEKIEILRGLSAEYAKGKTYIPRSKKPLDFEIDGTWDQGLWQRMAQAGVAARVGDQIKITHVAFEGDKLVLEINGGLKSGKKWYDHVEVGMGGAGRPVGNGDYAASTGTSIEINFHKPMENLTSADIKKLLLPLMDFDLRSASKLYSETLTPEVQKAVTEKRAIEGMDRDQVKLALGTPVRKYRETKDGDDLEDWIYGTPPGKVTFVTFRGNKVVKVKEQYAGLGSETAPRTVVP